MPKQAKMLDKLFHDGLRDIYFAEKKILSALPKMAQAAESEELAANQGTPRPTGKDFQADR